MQCVDKTVQYNTDFRSNFTKLKSAVFFDPCFRTKHFYVALSRDCFITNGILAQKEFPILEQQSSWEKSYFIITETILRQNIFASA